MRKFLWKIIFCIVGIFIIAGGMVFYRCHFDENRFFADITDRISTQKKNILIITPDATQNGAQIMLLNLAEILKKHDYNVTVIAYKYSGLLQKKYKKAGIPLYVWKGSRGLNHYQYADKLKNIMQKFDLLILNTKDTAYYTIICPQCNYIQWVHELSMLQDNRYCQDGKIIELPEYIPTNHLIIVPSELTFCKLPFKEILLHNNVQIVPYAINDTDILTFDVKKVEKMKQKLGLEGKIVFTETASIQKRKGQDIFMQAVKLLPPEYLQKAHFIIQGLNVDDKFYDHLKEEAANYNNVTLLPEMPHSEMGNIYALTSVLVLPSRKDPAPLVVAEAAANKIPAVISTMVGTTNLIQNGRSGFVVPCEDAAALAEKIKYFIDNPDKIKEMGMSAQHLYRQIYIPEVFEKTWLELIEQELHGTYATKDEKIL